ncbi:hypothetical protein LCGC14_1208870 [marine sediment metagenome]|uniref:Uncharacterized protein n=1 Tax=marine sediment metagenome TaxID=412755 RepID=A0A0F9PJD6_9ZZZZ
MVMKELLTLSVLILGCTFTVQANDRQEKLEYCQSDSDLAFSIMRARQSGETYRSLIELLGSQEDNNQDDREYIEKLTSMAYSFPVYDSDEEKDLAIEEFSDMVFRVCYQSNNE